jgi:hypothetical protein
MTTAKQFKYMQQWLCQIMYIFYLPPCAMQRLDFRSPGNLESDQSILGAQHQ